MKNTFSKTSITFFSQQTKKYSALLYFIYLIFTYKKMCFNHNQNSTLAAFIKIFWNCTQRRRSRNPRNDLQISMPIMIEESIICSWYPGQNYSTVSPTSSMDCISSQKSHQKNRQHLAEDCHQDCHCRSYKELTNKDNLIQPLPLSFVGRKPERNLYSHALPNSD